MQYVETKLSCCKFLKNVNMAGDVIEKKWRYVMSWGCFVYGRWNAMIARMRAGWKKFENVAKYVVKESFVGKVKETVLYF